MSSNRTERPFMRRIVKRIKRFMPQTMLGRSLLIIITPMILTLAVVTIIFFDRHWSVMTRRLSYAVAGEIALVSDQYNQLGPGEEWDRFRARMASELGLLISVEPLASWPESINGFTWSAPVLEALQRELEMTLNQPFYMDRFSDDGWLLIQVKMGNEVLIIQVNDKRLYSSTTYIFILWMLGAAFILMTMAVIFMRNQVRPIRRLAIAAEQFGKGLDVERFKPSGAAEVRQAATAFLVMRERIKRQINQRTDMLAGVSHDLRTPLTRLKLQCEMFDNTKDVQDMQADIKAMEDMIEGYLAFARGEGKEQPRTVRLNDILEDVVAESRRQGGHTILEPFESFEIQVRPNALRRCLTNLVSNASKYAGKAWVRVHQLPRAIEIIIEDDGPGIPAHQRDGVFRPFFRLEESRNPDTGGVGLGLSIAKDIALSHGGTIRLEDSPQGGLRVVVQLPQ